MKKLCLCMFLPVHWSIAAGGSQYQAKYLIDELKKIQELNLVYLTKRILPGYIPEGYKIYKFNTLPFLPFHKFYFDFLSVVRQLKRINPDIIYQRIGCAHTGIAGWFAMRHSSRLVWHIAHDNDVVPLGGRGSGALRLDRLNKRFLEYGIRNADAIIAQTEDQTTLLRDNYQRDVKAVIPNFHPAPTEEIVKDEPIKILWVANFKPWKQPEQFIRLAAELADHRSDIECIMIGAPSPNIQWQQELEEKMKTIEILNYMGPLSIEKVNEILAKAHIFVNTSLSEGFANTFIQAWMRELPVVSLHVNPDNVFLKKNVGFWAGSFKRMVECILDLVNNPRKMVEMGQAACEYAMKKHSIENVRMITDVLFDKK